MNLRNLTRPLRNAVGRLAATALRRGLSLLDYPSACRVGRLLGALVWQVAARERNDTLDNLRRAYPGAPSRWVVRTGQEVFERFGAYTSASIYVCLVDFAWYDRALDCAEWDAYSRSRDPAAPGAVIVLPHFGQFLLAAGAGGRCMRFEGMARPPRLEFTKDLAREMYDRMGFATHDQGSNLRALVRRIREGVSLGMVADHDVRRIGGAFVPFFGRMAYTPTGPVAAASMAGGELVVAVPVPTRRRLGRVPRSVIRVHPIPLQDTGDREADLAENTRRWSTVIEGYVRAYPEEWSWMNRRWRTRPDDRDRSPVWRAEHDKAGWIAPPIRA